jgi:hypothetical protein
MKIQQKYWWLLGGVVIGFAGAPLLRKTPVVGTVLNKIPSV